MILPQEKDKKIVLKLLEERLDYGHSIYMDNYYNSYNLAVKLLERKTYCTGTLGKNRKNNPVDLGSVTQKGRKQIIVLEWCPHRMAILENLLPQPVPTEQITLKIQHNLTKIENFKLREKRDGNPTKITREIIRKECKGWRAKKKRVATLYECKGCNGSPGYCTACFSNVHS
ncbi:unnamed protein product [Parnassius apollo]|uniref:(apollo) hypothetical protein n=1 Tax=Parnassius apollo TaxID=110799 RepID=A0A8S3XXZ9_PARAO|nr:unnamed protein product [Parnassius apollo]